MNMKKSLSLSAFAIALLFVSTINSFASAGEVKGVNKDDAAMQMHHLHIVMMNHGLEMVLEGASLNMLSEMKMAPNLNTTTLRHRRSMIQEGKAAIQQAMAGSEMKSLHEKGQADQPFMDYTHSLGTAMLAVVDGLSKMSPAEPTDPKTGNGTMTLHHMHITLHHALEMATKGSNLMMLGQMGMAKEVNSFSVSHGKLMLANARVLWLEVMEKAMKEMHDRGLKKKTSPEMSLTHDLSESVMKVVNLLTDMPSTMKAEVAKAKQ